MLSSSVAFIPFKGHFKEKMIFFSLLFPQIASLLGYCKSTWRRIGKYRRQIKKKANREVIFAYPSSSAIFCLSPTTVAESQWFIIIGRCHHADDTQSALWISLAPFAYLRSFFIFSPLSSRSFVPRLVSRFNIPKGNYHPRSSLSICADRHDRE